MDGRTESRKDGRTDRKTKTIYPSTYFVCRGYKKNPQRNSCKQSMPLPLVMMHGPEVLNFFSCLTGGGGSDGALVLGKLPLPGRPSNLDYSRARAYCACSRCGWGCLDMFSLIYLFSFLSPSLWETARYRLKYCLKGPLSPKQPTNHHHA